MEKVFHKITEYLFVMVYATIISTPINLVVLYLVPWSLGYVSTTLTCLPVTVLAHWIVWDELKHWGKGR